MLNSIVIQGRIAHTPELRHTPSGISVLNLSVAVQRSRKDADGNYQTDFFDCTLWGKLGENAAKFFQKGDQIIVKGRMESRRYEDKNGSKRIAWEVQADGYEFCGAKREHSANTSVDSSLPEGFDPDTPLCEMGEMGLDNPF